LRDAYFPVESIVLCTEVARDIRSNSQKPAVVSRLIEVAPSESVALVALLEAVDTIASSAEKRRVMEKLLERQNLPVEVHLVALDVIRSVASASEKSLLLSMAAPGLPLDHADVVSIFLKTLISLSATRQRVSVISRLLENPGLDKTTKARVRKVIEQEIPDPDVCRSLLARLGG